MPLWFLYVLLGLVVVGLAARLTVPALPVRPVATDSSAFDALLLVLGGLGLVLHCASMFYGSTVDDVPVLRGVVPGIDALGAISMVAFAVPAALLLVGLRRVWPPLFALDVAALTVVGVTMYDGGPLATHLGAILAAVVVLVATVATSLRVVGRPARRRRVPAR